MTLGSNAARSAGRPRSDAVHAALLLATQDLLIEVGFDRLALDAVAARAGTSKPTIYRRWKTKADLVVAAVADAKPVPAVPDTGSLREDLLACARAYTVGDDRTHRLLAGVLSEMARDEAIRVAAAENLGQPYTQLFIDVLRRAVTRGWIDSGTDIDTAAAIFPAFAFHRVAVEGKPVDDELVDRVIDGVVLALLDPSNRPRS
jgi:AcrR family transcriptional regulator